MAKRRRYVVMLVAEGDWWPADGHVELQRSKRDIRDLQRLYGDGRFKAAIYEGVTGQTDLRLVEVL